MNRYVKGKIEIGRIDLTANCSFFEVPEADAPIVLRKMAKAMIGDRKVVVDHAEREEGGKREEGGNKRERRAEKADKPSDRRAEKKADRKATRAPKEAPTKGGKKGRRGGRYEDADLFEKPKYKKEDWKQFFKD